MSLRSFLQYSKVLAPDDMSFFYQGEFSDDFTDKIIELGEYNINSKKEVSKSRKKFSFLVAECFQNVVRHGKQVEEDPDPKVGFFATRNIDRTFIITSANLIPNEHVEQLDADLKTVNSLSKDELRAYYREVLNQGEFSGKGGAGLGLIEMARRSGQPLEYSFEPVNDKFSNFFLQIRICGAEGCHYDEINLESSKALQQELMMDEILLLYKGDFATDSVMPVLTMIENNVQKQEELVKIRKRVYRMSVELLQNIAHHALMQDGKREGLFLMGKKDGQFALATGNYITKDQVGNLKAHLGRLSKMERPELSQLFKSTLFDGNENAAGRAGLGLVDVAKEARAALEFNFEPVDDELVYFSIAARL